MIEVWRPWAADMTNVQSRRLIGYINIDSKAVHGVNLEGHLWGTNIR
jgi:hypothetical protein